MFIIGATYHDLSPDSGNYTKTVTQTLNNTRYYKVVSGIGETKIFPAATNGTVPVTLNVHSQGGNGVEVSVNDGTLTIVSNYPGIGACQVIEYAEVIEDDTDVRTYVTNWLNPHPVTVQNWPDTYNVGNWPASYTVSGTVSLSSETISSLATAIASAIGT